MSETDDEKFIAWAQQKVRIYLTDTDEARLFALARRGAAMQWRPIDEAPKDGTPILIREGGLIITALYRSVYACKWVCPTGEGWLELGWINPTHWMPLPPPPKGAEE